MPSNRIAEAFVELSVKGKEKVQRAFVEVRQTGEKAVGGLRSKLNGLGEGLDKSTEGARKLQGALTGVVGTVGGVAGLAAAIGFGLGRAISGVRRALVGGKDDATDFIAALDPTGEPLNNLKTLRTELDRLNAVIGNAAAGNAVTKQFKALNSEGMTFNQLLEKRNELQREAASLAQREAVQRLRAREREEREAADAEAQRAKAARQAIEDENTLREAQLLRQQAGLTSQLDAVGIESQVAIEQAKRELASETDAGVQAALRTRIALIKEARDAQLAAIQEAAEAERESVAETERRKREEQARTHAEAMRQIEEQADAIEDLGRTLQDALNVNGTSGLGAGLADLNASLRALTLQPRQTGGPL